ncbi:RNA transcription, translation and transport factor protein-like, partial [Homarus americanus]
EKSFRELLVWLEDQKIRHYKIEDRGDLKAIDSNDWPTAYKRYLGGLNCPTNPNDLDKYKTETAENVRNRQQSAPKVVNTNPLDALDFQSPEFRDGIIRLTQQLNITPHPDHLITLKAISKLISTRLNHGKAYPIFEADLGFETGDYVLNSAGKALRLMYIHDLRELQTKINECIVSVQNITADPKTDTKLGKVGR